MLAALLPDEAGVPRRSCSRQRATQSQRFRLVVNREHLAHAGDVPANTQRRAPERHDHPSPERAHGLFDHATTGLSRFGGNATPAANRLDALVGVTSRAGTTG